MGHGRVKFSKPTRVSISRSREYYDAMLIILHVAFMYLGYLQVHVPDFSMQVFKFLICRQFLKITIMQRCHRQYPLNPVPQPCEEQDLPLYLSPWQSLVSVAALDPHDCSWPPH